MSTPPPPSRGSRVLYRHRRSDTRGWRGRDTGDRGTVHTGRGHLGDVGPSISSWVVVPHPNPHLPSSGPEEVPTTGTRGPRGSESPGLCPWRDEVVTQVSAPAVDGSRETSFPGLIEGYFERSVGAGGGGLIASTGTGRVRIYWDVPPDRDPSLFR